MPRHLDRKATLDEAARCVLQDRNVDYGTPEDNFRTIADFWTTLFGPSLKPGARIEAHQVALALDLLKTARLMHNPAHPDGWVDKAGYAACGAEIATKTRQPEGGQ